MQKLIFLGIGLVLNLLEDAVGRMLCPGRFILVESVVDMYVVDRVLKSPPSVAWSMSSTLTLSLQSRSFKAFL